MLEGELRLVGDQPQHAVGSAGDVGALAAARQTEHVARCPGDAVGAVLGLARPRDDVVQLAARLQLGAQRVAGADAQIAGQDQGRGRGKVSAQAVAQVERDDRAPCRRVERPAALGQKLVARHRRILQRERIAGVEVARPARVRGVGDSRPLALVPALVDRLQLRRHPVVPPCCRAAMSLLLGGIVQSPCGGAMFPLEHCRWRARYCAGRGPCTLPARRCAGATRRASQRYCSRRDQPKVEPARALLDRAPPARACRPAAPTRIPKVAWTHRTIA